MAKRALSNVTVEDLQEELKRRQRELPKLQKKRDKLAKQIEEIDKKIEDLGGTPGKTTRRGRKKGSGGTRKRASNKVSLGDAVEQVMSKDTPMSIKETTEKVLATGYQTNSKNFRMIVTQTLSKDDRFTQVERGTYKLA